LNGAKTTVVEFTGILSRHQFADKLKLESRILTSNLAVPDKLVLVPSNGTDCQEAWHMDALFIL
jgi:hypothetical protein